jgi:hypothetical protein
MKIRGRLVPCAGILVVVKARGPGLLVPHRYIGRAVKIWGRLVPCAGILIAAGKARGPGLSVGGEIAGPAFISI